MKNSLTILIFASFVFMASCSESEYSKLVKKERETGVIHDSLFLGLKLGQTQKQFFDTCWQLNEKQVVTNAGSLVKYVLPVQKEDPVKSDIKMMFYGIFDKDKTMTGMNMKFSYEAWSLWNKVLQSDRLALAVKDTLKSWYPGNDFLKVDLEKSKKEVWIKVDGNRRITIKPIDDEKEVKVQIDDLRYVLENEK